MFLTRSGLLHLIARESGSRFLNQSLSVVMQNQSKREFTFDTKVNSKQRYVKIIILLRGSVEKKRNIMSHRGWGMYKHG